MLATTVYGIHGVMQDPYITSISIIAGSVPQSDTVLIQVHVLADQVRTKVPLKASSRGHIGTYKGHIGSTVGFDVGILGAPGYL